ncbi:alpha-hydroxy acid oxidase [Thermogemmatispora sp.]|uniref:alpha-hydroxy acid oxidase n=1 Tax=Thermogemmatispora sp. TaxID=1968838 RepID=UPI001D7E4F6F|nr:alpha-hydroxy acid oxidase [Thermogemmatispora sp.]MBX5448683.1 alpha-hydroxy-acid oxidizing protein [Thermogemmatispora sp.]
MDLLNVFDYEALARERMDISSWVYYACGADDEVTLRANRNAFERIKLRPRVLVDVSQVEMITTVLGTPLAMPILIAPTALQELAHPEGECEMARGAALAGTLLVVSTSASRSLEEVAAAAGGPLWFQLYITTRPTAQRLVARAEAAGYQGLVLTVDTPRWGNKERAARHPLTRGIHKANFENESEADLPDPSCTWEIIPWLRSLTRLPLILKGILTPEDAQRACDYGVDAIIVSNHGGRQLDGVPATIEVLPEIVEAVAGRCEVYLDGGIRRGTDILKALALGARAVLVGRPPLWGLAVNGAQGVADVLDILRDELEQAMALAGCPRLADIDRSLIRLTHVS